MDRVLELEKLIKYHKALYYQGRPEIPDHEYDKLEDELKGLDPQNNALSIVGSVINNLEKVKHDTKMLSLNKTYKTEELEKWIEGKEVVSTFKIDGVSCSLIYEDGHLVLGKTRGDGTYGENITSKVTWISTVPNKISMEGEKIEIRGELYCTEENFFKLSEEMESLGLEKPTNQRNIVAGLMGRKENLELCRYINFMAFDLIPEKTSMKTEMDKAHKLQTMGFDIPLVILHKGMKRVEERISDAKNFMAEGNYQIDGMVFTFNDLDLHDQLGATAHHPRFKMAFKFQGESKTTILKKIVWNISRNGILTPIGEVEPVELSGAKISRVTLHNYGMVAQNNLKKGDKIEIVRSGEVIPKFLSVVEPSNETFERPINCPVCNSKVEQVEIRLFCSNEKCPGRVKESILNFIQKIGIDDLSSKRLDEMLRVKLIEDIEDLYDLKIEDFLTLDKVKEKLATKLFSAIEKSKDVDLTTFLSALGIQGGAYNKCEKVVQGGFNSMDKIMDLNLEKLLTVDSFAEKSATEFLGSLESKKPLIKSLLTKGFEFEEKEQVETKISGKKICITGSLSRKRSEIEKAIRDNGGIVVGSVSKNTDILLTNDTEAKSSKYKKAENLDIPILSEESFFQLLE